MQVIKSKGNIVERVLRDKDGKLIRARFFVYENAGRIKARLIDFVYVDIKQLAGNILSLSAVINKLPQFGHWMSKLGIVSPYFNKESLYFSGSKPRAPTFA